jgi:glycerophosphoryl diester phosphodiesterase
MDIVAHRGYGEAYPENTRFAFTEAAESADWIELDLRTCRTGHVLVFHDETLDRLTEDTGPLKAKRWSEIQNLRIEGSSETVLRLEDALSAIPAETGVQLELKEYGIADRVRSIVSDYSHSVRYISFSLLVLNEVRTLSPEESLGFILHPGVFGENPKLGLDLATHLGCSAVHLYPRMLHDGNTVALAKKRGLDVQAGFDDRNDEEIVSALEGYTDLGVDYVSLDKPLQGEAVEVIR